MPVRRIRMTVSYDGTNYCGWQIQPNGTTIEEVLNRALSDLLREPVCVIGASRTDSGVHAEGNVAVFDTESRIAADKMRFAVNQRLPEDIRILESEEVAPNWHPRKQNSVKTYEYRIMNRKIEIPTKRLYAHFCYYPLDVERMRAAAAYLIGEHDFVSFCSARHQAEETVRTLYRLDVEQEDRDLIVIRVSGNGFLYNMVRIIAGTLMKVGMGIYPPEHVKEILEARDRRIAGQKAAAKGLTLVGIEYEKEPAREIVGENEHWSYQLDQTGLVSDGRARLLVRRCEGQELTRLLRRMIHQAARNGAEEILVCDEAGRIGSGDIYGFYRLEESRETGWYLAVDQGKEREESGRQKETDAAGSE